MWINNNARGILKVVCDDAKMTTKQTTLQRASLVANHRTLRRRRIPPLPLLPPPLSKCVCLKEGEETDEF